jgi:hypothetical protein
VSLVGYLNDHLAGAAAAMQLAQRCLGRDPDGELGRVLEGLLVEIRQDREALERVIRALGGMPNAIKRATALGVERLSSVRMWLPILRPGPAGSARLEELEVLSLGIEGKRLMWEALAQVASTDERLSDVAFTHLSRRAKDQRERLERIRLRVAVEAGSRP